MEEWVTIRELARHGVTTSEIARRVGRDPKTIRTVLRADAPAPRKRTWKPQASKLAPYHDYLAHRVADGCLNASVLAEELAYQGYTGKLTILRDYLRPFRQAMRREREVTVRFETEPGEQAQVDWGDFGRIWEQDRWQSLYAFVFTLGYSRALFLTFVTRCDMEHFLACHVAAFEALGIPERLLYDNLKTAILGRRPDGTPMFPGRFLDFALFAGFTPTFCRPYRARTKGKVERSIRYIRENFWVRVAAEVAAGTLDLPGLNERAAAWVATVAHPRVHGTHGEIVADRLVRERPHLGSLMGRPRYDTAYHASRRVSRDGRISYGGQLYQVGLRHALSTVEVAEELDGQLRFTATTGAVMRYVLVSAAPPRPPAAEPEFPRLPLLAPRPAPIVPLRDLAIYEEVVSATLGQEGQHAATTWEGQHVVAG